MSTKVCSLPWCRQSGPHLTFQFFPDNEIKQLQWLTLLDVAETWKDVPPDKIRSYIICSTHFDTRGNLLRATSTPLVSTVHVQPPPPPAPPPKPARPASKPQQEQPPKKRPGPGRPPKSEKLAAAAAAAVAMATNGNQVSPPKIRKPAYAPIQPNSGPSTRESFSLARKMEIVRMIQNGATQSQVARIFNIPKSTLWCIWKSRDKIEQAFLSNGPDRKKLRKSNFEEVDQALWKWYNSVTSQNVTVTGRLLQSMAESFAQDLGQTNFVCTAGWLERFKQRYCIALSAHKKKQLMQEAVNQDIHRGVPNVMREVEKTPNAGRGRGAVKKAAPEPTLNPDAVPEPPLNSDPGAETRKISNDTTPGIFEKSDETAGIFETSDSDDPTLLPPSDDEDNARTKADAPAPMDSNEPARAPNRDLAPIIETEMESDNVDSTDSTHDKSPIKPPPYPISVQAADWIRHTWPKVSTPNAVPYRPQDIFAAEETGILYKISPETSWKMSRNRLGVPFDVAQERITVLLCTNSDGSEKRRLLVTGQSKRPPCIISIVGHDFSRLPGDYEPTSDPSGWLTGKIFGRWLAAWDESLARQKRRVLLLLKTTPMHEAAAGAASQIFQNLHIVLVPNQIFQFVHPFNVGIVKEFKWRYRRLQLERLIYYAEQNKPAAISLFDAVTLLSTAWSEISPCTVATAFRILSPSPTEVNNQQFESLDVSWVLRRAAEVGLNLPSGWELKDLVAVDDTLFAVDVNPTPEPEIDPEDAKLAHLREACDAAATAATTTAPHPMASLSRSEVQMYLDVIRVWSMTKGSPQSVHEALSTLQSFVYDHHKQ